MTLVVGIGLRAGTPYEELRELVQAALDTVGAESVRKVVTVRGKEAEPGLVRLAASLDAQVEAADPAALARQAVPTPSASVERLAGTPSVAEAAVHLSGAELVVPKQRSAGATVAVGRLPPQPADGYPADERDVVHRVLAERRDVRRGFLDTPIADDVLTRVLESAHRAPSVGLSQPWDFVLIRARATRQRVHALATAQRDAFAASLPADRRGAFDGLKIEAILDTPLNIAVTCDPGRGGRHVLGRHADPRTTWFSAAIAIQNLWLAARAEGLGVGWVSFFEPGEVGAVLGLPAHVELVGYLCVGHVTEFAAAPELVRSGWASRRPLSWAVHQETWGRRGLPGEQPGAAIAEAAAAHSAALPHDAVPHGAVPRDAVSPDAVRPHAVPPDAVRADAAGPAVVQTPAQSVEVVVVDGADPAAFLERPEVLVVQVGPERPAADFGVLWRPARSPDEAVEHGVEVARDLALQGVGRIRVELAGPSPTTAGLARGISLGGLACGTEVVIEPPDA